MGMLCDEVGLNTSAIMSLSADKLENKLCNPVKCIPEQSDEHCIGCHHKEPHDFKLGCEEQCCFSSSKCEAIDKTMEAVHKEGFK